MIKLLQRVMRIGKRPLMTNPNRFSRMAETRKEYFERKESNTQAAFERKVMKKLLLRLGVTQTSLGVLRPDMDEDSTGDYLSVRWVHENFPSLPIRFMTLNKAPKEGVLRPRLKGGIWDLWEEIHDALRGEEKAGMAIGGLLPIVPALDPHSELIIHNLILPEHPATDDIDLVFLQRSPIGGKTLTVENIDSFAARLKARWSP